MEESLTFIEMGAENNLNQDGVHTYFTEIFNKSVFDQLYIETAEYGWDTIAYHYLNALYYLNIPNQKRAQSSCYMAGKYYLATSGSNRNVLSRFGLTFHHINHLREYIDFGEHNNNRFLGFDGGQEVKGYSGHTDVQTESAAFPWYPPIASTHCVLPQSLLGKMDSLRQLDEKILNALDACGYATKSYFTVPGGYALVTQMEQFNEDGTSKKGKDRWNIKLQPSSFELGDYFKALFWGREGKYRILVFIITNQPFYPGDPDDTEVAVGTAQRWLKTGTPWLPSNIAKLPYSSRHRVTALVYEFELKESLTKARFLTNGSQHGAAHLKQSGIWENIK